MKIPHDRTYSYEELQTLTRSFCTQEPLIQFSIFKTNEEKSDSLEAKQHDIWYVDAPDIESIEPVFRGPIQFFTDYFRVTKNGSKFTPTIENPTWRQIINAFNDLLQEGDRQGVYLEGFRDSEHPIIRFVIGS